MDKEQDALELRAYLALQKGSLDWRGDLVAALLSDAPLSPDFRQTLATAIAKRTASGTRLELSGSDKNHLYLKGTAVRREYRKIASLIFDEMSNGATYEIAVERAADKLTVGKKKCELAVTYLNDYKKWAVGKSPPSAWGEHGDELMAAWYDSAHYRNKGYVPKNGTAFDDKGLK